MKNFKLVPLVVTLCTLAISCQQEDATIAPPTTDIVTTQESKIIIGQDNREESHISISYQTKEIIPRVGKLQTSYETGNESCTASLIDRNHVITAAHCAFKGKTPQLHTGQHFYPGVAEGKSTPYSKFKVKKVYLPKDYDPTEVSAEDDIAIMELDQDQWGKSAGQRVGTLGYWGKDDFPLQSVTTLGYPNDKPKGRQFAQVGCNAQSYNNYTDKLEIDCDVISGQSGSPILVWNNKRQSYYLQGVVTSSGSYVNYGTGLTTERSAIVKQIVSGRFSEQNTFSEKWIQKVPDSPDTVDIFVKNTCSNRDLLIAINYKNLSGEWVSEGYYRIKPFKEHLVIKSKNGVYYIQAFSEKYGRLTRNDKRRSFPNLGRDLKVQRYSVNKWGAQTHHYGCN